MEQGQLNWIANFIWGIADDVLRNLYVRAKYRNSVLSMTVLRRLDAVLESTKQAVLDMKASLDAAGITNQDQALRQAAGQAFYNTSKFTRRDGKDPRLLIEHCENGEYSLVTRSSDGQMLLLTNTLSKRMHGTARGSRSPELRPPGREDRTRRGPEARHEQRAPIRHGAVQAVHGQRGVPSLDDGYGVRADL